MNLVAVSWGDQDHLMGAVVLLIRGLDLRLGRAGESRGLLLSTDSTRSGVRPELLYF